jgi:hypothetical protein
MTRLESLHQTLVAVGEGVGCEHWTVPDHGLPVALLQALGYARPIGTRVPRCSEHECRYLGACPQQVVFEEGRAGRAGRKFRLTPEGLAAAREPARLRGAVYAVPLAEAVLAALAAGECTIFELTWTLIEPSLAALDGDTDAPEPPARVYLRATLDLLAADGRVDYDEGAGLVRLAQMQPPEFATEV